MSEAYQNRVVKIKVIGVGGAGNNVINRMIGAGVDGVDFVVINTDKQDLNKSVCQTKVQIGEKLTGGMGAGSKPEIGLKSAEESRAAIAKVLENTDMVLTSQKAEEENEKAIAVAVKTTANTKTAAIIFLDKKLTFILSPS